MSKLVGLVRLLDRRFLARASAQAAVSRYSKERVAHRVAACAHLTTQVLHRVAGLMSMVGEPVDAE